MNKTIYLIGIIFGVLAVVLGAMGAHALEKQITIEALQTFDTGVKYQMYHALFLLVLGNNKILNETKKKLPFYLIVAGVMLFSFSIYLLALNTLTSFDFKILGIFTPIGGILLILGWVVTAYHVWKSE